MRLACVILSVALLAWPAWAAESGCSAFKWPLDQERALLATAPAGASGGTLSLPSAAVSLALVPLAEAVLPLSPERTPRDGGSFAGFVRIPNVPQAGDYRVTLSAEAWIDVVQNGAPLKPAAFTGATGCEGVRKSVTFTLTTAPVVIQLSSVRASPIAIAVTPAMAR